MVAIRPVLRILYHKARNVKQKLLYETHIKRPELPHGIGMTCYQKNSSWSLNPNICPCDVDFTEYLKESKIEGKNIFHFGTGEHHIIGLENHKLNRPNEIIGITASVPEHQAYVQLVLKNRALAKYYKVLFGDIYTLTVNTLPQLDIVNLFHLCEFYLPENAPFIHQNDKSLVQLFLSKLNLNGKILFYSGSLTWSFAEPLIKEYEAAGKLTHLGKYKSLLIYAKSF